MWVLAGAEALGLAAAPLVILVGGLVGGALAPAPSLATLPIAAMVVGVACSTVPAALLMRRFGRRGGSIAGALGGTAGALLGAWAVAGGRFWAFCAATALIGSNLAFVQQYRFAAVESVEPTRAGRAVSLVLLGGVAGGLLGPEMARLTRGWLDVEYAGSFIALAGLTAALAVLLTLLRDVAPIAAETTGATGRERSVRELASQPDFVLAAAAAIVANGVMSLVMTATPISMYALDGHPVASTTRVIQAHVVAMYLPSLFTGAILARLGPRRTMKAGALAMLGSVAIASSSHAPPAYGTALVLLGLGWNFLFIGGTVLLARTYRPAERFRAQAMNDFLVFGTQAAASLSAGAALAALGWRNLNLLAATPLLVMLALIFVLRARPLAGAAAAPAPAD